MAFNLYFASSGEKSVIDFKLRNNTNQLLSQVNEKRDIMKWINYMKTNPNHIKLFVDSGAWSAHSKDMEIDIDEYIRFLNEYDEYFYIFAELDKIPGEFRKPKTTEQKLEAPKISWQNYLYMKDKLKSRDKLLPIFHQGEDFKWLKNMLEYTHPDTGKHIPYIGISPSNDVRVSEKIPFIEECFKIIKSSSNPEVKTHAFGMTSLKVLEQYPFTSADSTSWKICAGMGSIMTPYGIIYISDRNKYDKSYILNQPKEAQTKIIEYVNKWGYTFEQAAEADKIRCIINLKYLMEWAKNYEYKPNKIKNNKLF